MGDLDHSEGATDGQIPLGTPEQKTPEEVFHTYVADDKTEHKFKNADELNTFIRQGAMRNADYTNKTKALAELRRSYEERAKDLERRTQEFESRRGKYDQYNEFLNKRPEIGQYIEQNMRNPNPDALLQQARGYTDTQLEQLQRQQEELQAWRDEQEQLRQKDEVFKTMSDSHADFDAAAVEERLTKLQEAPPGDEFRTLVEMLHEAVKGSKTPLEIEQKITEDSERKARSVTPTKPGATIKASEGPRKFKDLQEAKQVAMKEMGEGA